ncbi:hypothetical protein H5410_037333 [Solanum commersonii]|uniref:Uncharacterized protein n=1 Tax=Solanum commersonii TaxID=4109 RepID=A0A9J5Y7H8_SOLCO|nr:hypothetical protein H5410_037333 [Solanum commersonii]
MDSAAVRKVAPECSPGLQSRRTGSSKGPVKGIDPKLEYVKRSEVTKQRKSTGEEIEALKARPIPIPIMALFFGRSISVCSAAWFHSARTPNRLLKLILFIIKDPLARNDWTNRKSQFIGPSIQSNRKPQGCHILGAQTM